MTIVFQEYNEETGSSMKSGCSMQGGQSTIRYILQDETEEFVQQADLIQVFTDVLGKVNLNGGNPTDGTIDRQTPLVHPLFPFWTAFSVNSLIGTGRYELTDAFEIPNQQANNFQRYAHYEAYWCDIAFAPLPYPALENDFIETTTFVWTYFDGTPQQYTYANEWYRYCTIEETGQFNNVTIPIGQMKFDDTSPNFASLPPFHAPIRKYVPDILMKFTWHQVPFRYWTSPYSYLRRFAGLVNQNPWNPGGFQGGFYGPGQVLYLGAQPKTYVPPVPAVLLNRGIYDMERLMDVELMLLITNRTCSTVPVPTNPNYITSGHNLQPSHKDMKFHYATLRDPVNHPGDFIPSWKSFPIELLFTDPDFSQPGGWQLLPDNS